MSMNDIPKASGGGGFKMKPGSKGVSSEGTFRQDSPLKQLGFAPAGGMGASPAMDKKDGKRKLGTEGMSYKEKMAYYKKQAANSKKQGNKGKSVKLKSGVGTANRSDKTLAKGVKRGKNREAKVGGVRIKAKW